MTLNPGTRLGPYEIQAAIGAGGMGEVYKAKDTRLDRSVAIKVLPAHVSADPDRRVRFTREAKAIAGLNHPHICTLHDVGEQDGTIYLVMEHLTGETLAERLEKGPLPLEQALTVATEIADALTAAHRQGVIHRDLKPGNVMLTKSGAKLLDFGLAKLKAHGEQPAAASLASAPTLSKSLTAEGAIIGTLQYMAPEQVEGKPADARTDLWALGAILYEMLTGRRAFEGKSAASLIGAILEREPAPLATLQPLTPRALDRLVRRCLAKSPDDRPDTAHDLSDELRWMRETSVVGAPTGVHPRRRRGLYAALLLAGALGMAAGGVGVMWLLHPAAPQLSLARLSVDVRPAEEVDAGARSPGFASPRQPGGSDTALTWTPDGQALVFVGRRGGVQQLYVRRLDAAEARPLPGTEGARVPAISPDGQWVAFWAAGAIRKGPLNGGPVMGLASGLSSPMGMVWGAGGRLFFGSGDDGRIWAIPPGGAPVAVTTVGGGERAHVLPCPLPGERVLLFTLRKREYTWGDEEIVAQTLATAERKVLLKDAADARYVPTGHLVFVRRGQLFAVPFDPKRLDVRGLPVAVLDGVAQALTGADPQTGAGQFAVAATGTLAWLPGPVASYPEGPLVTVDRRGQVSPLPAPVKTYWGGVRVSPDGRRLAVAVVSLTEWGLWLYDFGRPGMLTKLPGGGEASWPIWAPDGQGLVFAWLKDGWYSHGAVPVDGTSPPRIVAAGNLMPSSFTPDGQQVAAVRDGADIVVVTVEKGQPRVQPLLETPQTERWPEISPDGRWLAYGSDRSGRTEVYVQAYPGPGSPTQVSVDGGVIPVWNPNGRELFYGSRADAPASKRWMMAVEFAAGSPPRIGTPRRLFEFDRDLVFLCSPVRCYDVAPDGQRFYVHQMRATPSPPPVTHINIVQNWFEELKAKVPTGR